MRPYQPHPFDRYTAEYNDYVICREAAIAKLSNPGLILIEADPDTVLAHWAVHNKLCSVVQAFGDDPHDWYFTVYIPIAMIDAIMLYKGLSDDFDMTLVEFIGDMFITTT